MHWTPTFSVIEHQLKVDIQINFFFNKPWQTNKNDQAIYSLPYFVWNLQKPPANFNCLCWTPTFSDIECQLKVDIHIVTRNVNHVHQKLGWAVLCLLCHKWTDCQFKHVRFLLSFVVSVNDQRRCHCCSCCSSSKNLKFDCIAKWTMKLQLLIFLHHHLWALTSLVNH